MVTRPSPAGRGQVLGDPELFLGLWPRPLLANQLPGFEPFFIKILSLVVDCAEATVSYLDSRDFHKDTLVHGLMPHGCWGQGDVLFVRFAGITPGF